MIWRAAWLVAVVLMLIMWRACLGPRFVIQVHFGMDPEFFTGAEVFIDGELVGTLQPLGRRTLSGFEVEPGDHAVEVRREGCASRPAQVTAGATGSRVVLMAVPDSEYRGAADQCVIRLDR